MSGGRHARPAQPTTGEQTFLIETTRFISLKNVHSTMIADVLETEILTGGLEPGARLSEETLAQRFGVSRTPVREALQNIVSRSLAERVPYKGVIVRQFDPNRIETMFEAMAEIEALCGGLACERMTAQDVEHLTNMHLQLAEISDHKAAREYEALNTEFHGMIYRFSGNEDLAQMAFDMRMKLAPFRKSQLFRRDRMAQSNSEHDLIVKLFASGNRPGVEAALRAHLNGAARAFLEPRPLAVSDPAS